MKAALNGCLNLSIRDGWWDELYDGQNGWAIPSADDPTIEPDRRDQLEARPSTTCSSTRSCRCSTTGRTACPGAGSP
jgi:glucan phosphorylase